MIDDLSIDVIIESSRHRFIICSSGTIAIAVRASTDLHFYQLVPRDVLVAHCRKVRMMRPNMCGPLLIHAPSHHRTGHCTNVEGRRDRRLHLHQ
jgi:hypothetical protein